MNENTGDIQDAQPKTGKWKKWVEWIFVTFGLFVGFLVCCGLRAVISRFSRDINYEKYNRKNPKCYEKCKKAYKGDKNIPWKYVDHLNHCESVCIEPRWNACIENCKLTTLGEELKGKYNYENYENWFKNKYPGSDPVSFADAMKNGGFVSHDILKGERQYRQWINEVFSGHKDEVKKYELCEESCGSAPKYTFIN